MLIKKEKDRKFYNSTTKEYITLKQIAGYLSKKIDFKVIDKNNKDISLKTTASALLKHGDPNLLNSIITPLTSKKEDLPITLCKDSLAELKSTLPSIKGIEVYKSIKKEDWIIAKKTIEDFKLKNEKFYHLNPQSFRPEVGEFILIFKENSEIVALLHFVKDFLNKDCSIVFHSIKKEMEFIKIIQSYFLENHIDIINRNSKNCYLHQSLSRIGIIIQKEQYVLKIHSIYNDISNVTIKEGEFRSLGLKKIPKANYTGYIDFTDNEICVFEPSFFNKSCKSLDLRHNKIKSLPEHFELNYFLRLSYNEIENFNLNWKLNSNLDLSNNKITSLSKNLQQNGFSLNLCCNQINTIEEGFVQEGILNLDFNQIKEFPKNYHHKKGELFLVKNLLEQIPSFFPVDKVSLIGNPISNKETNKNVFFST